MPDTAETHSATLTTNRNCTIEIHNASNNVCLVNPKIYMNSGFCYNPPQPTLQAGMTEVCSFTKDDNTASGAVGVLTYELFNITQRQSTELLAVMFSVPFDYNFYKNWMSLGIFEKSKPCDEKLYEFMYESKDFTNFVRQKADGSGLVHKGRVLDLRGTMSDRGRAIVKLELYDKL